MNLTDIEKKYKVEKNDNDRLKKQLADWRLKAEVGQGDLKVNEGSLTMARREVANQIKEVRSTTQANETLKNKA
jgi:ribosomal protein L29